MCITSVVSDECMVENGEVGRGREGRRGGKSQNALERRSERNKKGDPARDTESILDSPWNVESGYCSTLISCCVRMHHSLPIVPNGQTLQAKIQCDCC